MRFKFKPRNYVNPAVGDVRYRTVFLWFPKRAKLINATGENTDELEWRWLETVTVKEICGEQYCPHSRCHVLYWDTYWVDGESGD